MLPVEIDFSRPFPASEEPDWEQEYLTSVTEECFLEPRQEEERKLLAAAGSPLGKDDRLADDWMDDPFFYSDRLEVTRVSARVTTKAAGVIVRMRAF